LRILSGELCVSCAQNVCFEFVSDFRYIARQNLLLNFLKKAIVHRLRIVANLFGFRLILWFLDRALRWRCYFEALHGGAQTGDSVVGLLARSLRYISLELNGFVSRSVEKTLVLR
jgi:hypothetical protein